MTTDTLPEPADHDPDAFWWILPTLALVAGVVLGAVGGGTIASGADSGDSAPVGPPSSATSVQGTGPSATPTGDLVVRVPSLCADLAAEAQGGIAVLGDAVTAARNLDAERFADVLQSFGTIRDRLGAGVGPCGSAAAGGGLSATRN